MTRSIFALAGTAALALAGAAAAQTEVRIASHVSDTSPLYAQAEMFAERVQEALGEDQFTFNFYPNGQLGKESALIDNIRLGSLEMAVVASGVLGLDDKLGVFDLPWLFTDRDDVRRAVTGEFGAAVRDRIEAEQGFQVLGIYENGFRHVLNKTRAIETPDDMEGMKIRVTGSEFKRQGFSAMGADPVPVAWQETFTALQQGVVDGAEAALYGLYGANLYEITDYLSLTSHTYSPSFLIVSDSFWNGLDAEQRETIEGVAVDMTDAVYEQAAELETGYLDSMSEAIEVNEVDPAPFQEAASGVYDTYVEEFGAEWLDLVRQAGETG